MSFQSASMELCKENTEVLNTYVYLIILGPKSSLNFINIPISNATRNSFYNPNLYTVIHPIIESEPHPYLGLRSALRDFNRIFGEFWH